jgi:hypothetical protein
MGAMLEHALRQSGAARGVVFDGDGVVRSIGYSASDRSSVCRALGPLLLEPQRLVQSHHALFGVLDGPGWGLAGSVTGASGPLAVLAVEKESPLDPAEVDDFADWIGVTGKPLDAAFCYARWRKTVHRQPLRLRDLPLADLAQIPNLAEVERLLIAVAMNRSQNNRGKAAAALGISREGLRKRLLREEI